MSKHPKWSFSQCMRHAFFTGAGYGDLEKITPEDLKRWTGYEPPDVGCFKAMDEHFALVEKDTQKLAEDAAVMTLAAEKIEEQRAEIERLRKQVADWQMAYNECALSGPKDFE